MHNVHNKWGRSCIISQITTLKAYFSDFVRRKFEAMFSIVNKNGSYLFIQDGDPSQNLEAFSWRHGRGKRWTLTDTPTESRFEPIRKYISSWQWQVQGRYTKIWDKKGNFSVFSGLCYRHYTLYLDKKTINKTKDQLISYC